MKTQLLSAFALLTLSLFSIQSFAACDPCKCGLGHPATAEESAEFKRKYCKNENNTQKDVFLHCKQDDRPADGDYQEIKIVTNEFGLHDIFQTFKPGGFTSPGQPVRQPVTNLKIGADLKCSSLPVSTVLPYYYCFNPRALSSAYFIETQQLYGKTFVKIKNAQDSSTVAFFNGSSCTE